MNKSAEVLSELISDYYSVSKQQSFNDCRILIPGLEASMAKEVHVALLGRGLPSYFVVQDGDETSEEKKVISLNGVTSKRIGSMILLVSPGLTAYIPDSVKGSGGAMRSFAFQDSWPWGADGNESFSFSRFIDKYCEKINASQQDCEWLKSLFLTLLLPELSAFPNRHKVLFLKLLGEFTAPVDGKSFRCEFLRHCGLPWSTTQDNPVQYMEEVAALCRKVSEDAFKKWTRQELVDRVVSDPSFGLTSPDIEAFLDGISGKSFSYNRVFYFSDSVSADIKTWRTYTVEKIQKIFSIPRKGGQLALELFGGKVYKKPLSIVVPDGEPFEVKMAYDSQQSEPVELRIFCGGKELLKKEHLAPVGAELVSLDPIIYGAIKNKNGAKIRVAISVNRQDLKEATFELYVYGQKNPVVAFVVVGGSEIENEVPQTKDAEEKIFVDQPVTVDVFVFPFDSAIKLTANKNDVALTKDSRVNGYYYVATELNPSDEPTGQIELELWEQARLISSVIVESATIIRREFSVEAEVLKILSENLGARAVRPWYELFKGETGTLLKLGNKNTIGDRLRAYLGKWIEDISCGLPLIADLTSQTPIDTATGPIKVNNLYKGATNLEFAGLDISADAAGILGRYQDARGKVIDLYKTSFKWGEKNPDRPLYAQFPAYLDTKKNELESLILKYLDVYAEILKYLNARAGNNQYWADIFLLTHLDAVVNWRATGNPDDLSQGFALLSPWHPLMVARRFELHAEVFKACERYVNGKMPLACLAMQLLEDSHIKLIPVVARPPAANIKNFYCALTSDSGWLLAVSMDQVGSDLSRLKKCLLAVKTCLGVECDILPLGEEYAGAKSAISDFHRANPAKQSISILVRKEISAEEIISGCRDLLFEKDGAKKEFSRLLPGGIHVYLEGTEPNLEQILPDIEWGNPPFCIYPECDPEKINIYIDIEFASPTANFGFQQSELCTLRGNGNNSLFSKAQKRCHNVNNRLYSEVGEMESTCSNVNNTVGDKYLEMLSTAARLSSAKVNLQLELGLPTSLRYSWTVLPGHRIDPALFVKYVSGSKGIALWDYNVDIKKGINSYFVLAKISSGFISAISGSPLLGSREEALNATSELGNIGVAIGAETMKTGKKSHGVIGVVGAVRLLKQFLPSSEDTVSFIVPIDAFKQFFPSDDGKRADLLAFTVKVIKLDGRVIISACAVESKYCAEFSLGNAQLAAKQASATYLSLKNMIEQGKTSRGAVERLSLLELISFGFRLASAGNTSAELNEAAVLKSVLNGCYEYIEPVTNCLVISSEYAYSGGNVEVLDNGKLWVRLGKEGWPTAKAGKLFFDLCSRINVFMRDEVGGGREIPTKVEAVAKKDSEGDNSAASTSPEPAQELPINNPANKSTGDAPVENNESSPLLPIKIGFMGGAYINYDPQCQGNPLENLNIMVTGSSGKGKTMMLKTLIAGIRAQERNIIVVDFKNDFASDPVLLKRSRIQCQDVSNFGLPYNPLIPPVRFDGTGQRYWDIPQHISGLTAVFKKNFGLGPQQENSLKECIRESYRDAGIEPKRLPFESGKSFPDFEDVGRKMQQADVAARRRMDPIFDLGIFLPEFKTVSFEEMLKKSFVLQLNMIDSDPVKDTLAQILIMSAKSYYNTLPPQISGSRQYFVLDEANRVLKSEYTEELARKCRAYGVGLILSSQYISDFPADVSGNFATKIVHGNGRDAARVEEISRLNGLEGKRDEIAALDMFEAVVSSPHHQGVFIGTLGFPLHLVCKYFQDNGGVVSSESVKNIEGVDPTRVGQILEKLIRGHLVLMQDSSYKLVTKY